MSKIVEQKALEEYPKSYVDENIGSREGYAKGYDQATQDFLRKACEYLTPINYTHPHLIDLDDFKNYIQNEM